MADEENNAQAVEVPRLALGPFDQENDGEPRSARVGTTQVLLTPRNSQGRRNAVEVVRAYLAQRPDELSLQAGSIVSNVEEISATWWRGSSQGRVGVFPMVCVRRLYAPSLYVVALWDFQTMEDNELPFFKGDVIYVTDEEVSGEWYYGRLERTRRSGWFPRKLTGHLHAMQYLHERSAATDAATPTPPLPFASQSLPAAASGPPSTTAAEPASRARRAARVLLPKRLLGRRTGPNAHLADDSMTSSSSFAAEDTGPSFKEDPADMKARARVLITLVRCEVPVNFLSFPGGGQSAEEERAPFVEVQMHVRREPSRSYRSTRPIGRDGKAASWYESFAFNVYEPEHSVLRVVLTSGGGEAKQYWGEVPLRSTEREPFERCPTLQRWLRLEHGVEPGTAVPRVQFSLTYAEMASVGRPEDWRHLDHAKCTGRGTFEVSDSWAALLGSVLPGPAAGAAPRLRSASLDSMDTSTQSGLQELASTSNTLTQAPSHGLIALAGSMVRLRERARAGVPPPDYVRPPMFQSTTSSRLINTDAEEVLNGDTDDPLQTPPLRTLSSESVYEFPNLSDEDDSASAYRRELHLLLASLMG